MLFSVFGVYLFININSFAKALRVFFIICNTVVFLLPSYGLQRLDEPSLKRSTIEIYYTWPDVQVQRYKKLLTSDFLQFYHFKTTGPVGIAYDFKLSTNWSVNIACSYSHTSSDATIIVPTLDANFNIIKKDYYQGHINVNFIRPKLGAGYSIFFNKKIQLYVNGGIVYNLLNYNYTSDYPDKVEIPDPAFLPLTGRLSGGLNYMLGTHMCLNAEAGFSGGYIVKSGVGFIF